MGVPRWAKEVKYRFRRRPESAHFQPQRVRLGIQRPWEHTAGLIELMERDDGAIPRGSKQNRPQ
jgi:hypothetical protein